MQLTDYKKIASIQLFFIYTTGRNMAVLETAWPVVTWSEILSIAVPQPVTTADQYDTNDSGD